MANTDRSPLASFLDSHVTVTRVTLTPRETLSRVVSGSSNPPIVEVPARYVKIRFTGRYGATAGLIFTTDKANAMTLGELSRHFTRAEARNMAKIERSPEYDSWDAAFAHDFD